MSLVSVLRKYIILTHILTNIADVPCIPSEYVIPPRFLADIFDVSHVCPQAVRDPTLYFS